jgi:hypothetical protein
MPYTYGAKLHSCANAKSAGGGAVRRSRPAGRTQQQRSDAHEAGVGHDVIDLVPRGSAGPDVHWTTDKETIDTLINKGVCEYNTKRKQSARNPSLKIRLKN